MKIEIENNENCKINIKIIIDEENLKSYESDIIADFMKLAPIKGFRPGKAPKGMVLRQYKDKIKNEVLSKNLPKILMDVFKDQKVRVIGEPYVDNLNYDITKELSFNAIAETYPEFELDTYKDLELTKQKIEINDKNVDDYINQMADYGAQFEVINDRDLKDNDFAIVDYSIMHDEKEVDKRDGFWMRVILDSGDDFVKSFCNEINGMKIGSQKEFEMTLSDNYKDEDLRGQKVMVKVTLKEIRKKVLPEINDEYVKKLNQGHENLEQYKSATKDLLQKQNENESEKDVNDQIKKHLLLNHRFDLPKMFLENNVGEVYKNRIDYLRKNGYSEQYLNENNEEIFKNVHEEVLNQLKLEFIYYKIIEAEKIEVNDEDLNKASEKEAKNYGMNSDMFLQMLKKNNRLDFFKQNILIEKVFNFIKENSKINEITEIKKKD